jgi:cytochrome b subunit of formate dehydrogenase
MARYRCSWALLLTAATLLLGVGCGGEAPTAAPRPIPSAATQPATLSTDVAALKQSVHAELSCSDCHPGASEKQDSVVANETRCAPCHESAARKVERSAHASGVIGGRSPAAVCVACHGAHDVAAVTDPPATGGSHGMQFRCVTCHRNPEAGLQYGIDPTKRVQQYFETTHARAVIEDGLVGAPDCLDCHGTGHLITGADHADSPTNPRRIAETCGRCHVGALEEFSRSSHAQPPDTIDPRRPGCPDCHRPHAAEHPPPNAVCGDCHADRLSQYLKSHHGQASALGDTTAAVCSDCHTKHAILPVDDPDSSLSSANREATCGRCHANVTASFTQFSAHADPSNRDDYPLLYWLAWGMNALLLGALVVFLAHTGLWTVRNLLVFVHDPQDFLDKRRRWANEQGRPFLRFRAVDRFSHALLALSFLVLVATGMPLKFHDAAWAQALSGALGGVREAAGLHRLAAVLILVSIVLHLVSVVFALQRAVGREPSGSILARLRRVWYSPDSLAPRLQDARDLWAHLKWFVGRGPRPTFDRFTYWEKLDYFAVFWGLMIIGASGLVMLVPVWTAELLPGWAVNVAQMIHSEEALLVAGFIFVVHFFNVHFRVDRFPLDTVMFSGRISEEQMREERARQYARLVAGGRLEEHLATDDWRDWKPIAATLGLLAVAIGAVLVVAMAWGAVGWFQWLWQTWQ